MKDYGFDELLKLCKEISSRTDEGNRVPDVGWRSEEEISDLLCSLHEAGVSLQRIGYMLFAGGRIAPRVRADPEVDALINGKLAASAAGGAR